MYDVGRVDPWPLSEVRLFPAASSYTIDVVVTASFTLAYTYRCPEQTLRLRIERRGSKGTQVLIIN